MKWLLPLALLIAVPATAQTRNQSVTSGGAGVQSRLQSQGYSGVHDLRRLPDGSWTGKATQNGVEHTVTVAPDSTTTKR